MAADQWKSIFLSRTRYNPYQHQKEIFSDVAPVLETFRDLRPTCDTYKFNDGSRKEFLCIDGTIPVFYKGIAYNIPIRIWLLDTYPDNPPICYVKPTPTMLIKPSKYVDANGKIYLPYLHEWQYPSMDLLGLVEVICAVFADNSPLFAKGTQQGPHLSPKVKPKYQRDSQVPVSSRGNMYSTGSSTDSETGQPVKWEYFVRANISQFKTQTDVLQLLQDFGDLKPSLDMYDFGNNGITEELLLIQGTVPVRYKGNTYYIPICIWLMNTHPNDAPVCFVRPSRTMVIKTSKYVGYDGRVRVPYLQDWSPSTSNLHDLVDAMCGAFGVEIPLVSEIPLPLSSHTMQAQPALNERPLPPNPVRTSQYENAPTAEISMTHKEHTKPPSTVRTSVYENVFDVQIPADPGKDKHAMSRSRPSSLEQQAPLYINESSSQSRVHGNPGELSDIDKSATAHPRPPSPEQTPIYVNAYHDRTECESFVKANTSKTETQKDILTLLKVCRGLKPKLDNYEFATEGVRRELLILEGTLPISSKGNTIDVPIRIWLMSTHPDDAPMCFVIPKENMAIKSTMNVKPNGRVRLRNIQDWNSSSKLIDLVKEMCDVFGEDLPVIESPEGRSSLTNPMNLAVNDLKIEERSVDQDSRVISPSRSSESAQPSSKATQMTVTPVQESIRTSTRPISIATSEVASKQRSPIPRPRSMVPLNVVTVDPTPPGPDECYPLSHTPRGLCCILSNSSFELARNRGRNLPDRKGSQKDIEELWKTFSDLHFIVDVKENLKASEMYRYFQAQAGKHDQLQADCFVCCILTHGQLGQLCGTDGELLEILEVTSMFKGLRCPNLVGKPKLFFIQACRGTDQQIGVPYIENDATLDLTEKTLPNEADFLMGYATVPGYVSYRHTEEGSWYIQTLTAMLNKHHASMDIHRILTRVNREVSEKAVAVGDQMYTQIPAPAYTLRKDLYL